MLRGICKWSASNVLWCLLKCGANKWQLKCPVISLFFTILSFGVTNLQKIRYNHNPNIFPSSYQSGH
jgi:hypothetical protein